MPRRPRGAPVARRTWAPPASRSTAPRAALGLAAALCLAAACGGSSPATITIPPGSTSSSASSGAGDSATASLGLPTPALSPGGSGGAETPSQPPASATVPPVSAPASTPAATSAGPSSAAPSSSASTPPGGDRACTGTSQNQAFFRSVAAGVSWTVYCAVLPAGWYLQQGNYDLDGGGQMTVTYQGPGGVHLQLQEGAFCTGGTAACAPHDTVIGPTAYGDLDGQLMALSPGYAVYVDPGQAPSWAAASVDLDEATFVRLVAALQAVRGG